MTVTEGDHGNQDAFFTVTLSAAPSRPVTVHYITRDDTAAADIDYVATEGTLTFNPGDPLIQTISVPIIGNTADGPDRIFAVHLSMVSHASVRDSRAVGTILDNDPTPPPPSIMIEDASITEGRRGTKLLIFRVTLSAASANWVSVNYATADGAAKTRNNDYMAASGTLTFAPGQTEATVEVVIKGDKRREGNETFAVNLSDAVDAVIAGAQAIGTILNDDR
jgi:hypothetical protein